MKGGRKADNASLVDAYISYRGTRKNKINIQQSGGTEYCSRIKPCRKLRQKLNKW